MKEENVMHRFEREEGKRMKTNERRRVMMNLPESLFLSLSLISSFSFVALFPPSIIVVNRVMMLQLVHRTFHPIGCFFVSSDEG